MDSGAGSEAKRSESGPAFRRWSFAQATLDERSLELMVRGQESEIERKPLEVLLYLLSHSGEVVSKDELLEAVWPGRIISDGSLTKCMAKLRDAIGDAQQDIIKTVHDYGYRLIAQVRVETVAGKPLPHFDFKIGDHPPLRPQWSLVERLGTGGHGEAWLARHDKTHEPRVFKFALDSAALVSLKREITLYRLLHDSLGEKAKIVGLLEWNLEQAPYFTESEFIGGGNLVSWAESQGGLASVSLPLRLDIAAQIAEALAPAHALGVLHKDLKPSNVLIDVAVKNPQPRVRLCDFGSGAVLDPQRLTALGITRLGFTQNIDASSSSGTPLYLAPELLAGQPPTVLSDLYSLGVMLYQLLVGEPAAGAGLGTGDRRRAAAPGHRRRRCEPPGQSPGRR